MGSHHKKGRDKNIETLTDRNKQLESLHKQSLTVQMATKLLENRKVLQQLFNDRSRRYIFFKKTIYYEAGNKYLK